MESDRRMLVSIGSDGRARIRWPKGVIPETADIELAREYIKRHRKEAVA